MTGPLILTLLGVALVAFAARRRRPAHTAIHRRAALRFAWDLIAGLFILVGFAIYTIAPKHVRPTIRARILPRSEIPRSTIFRRMLRTR
jgi:hypothetical protein